MKPFIVITTTVLLGTILHSAPLAAQSREIVAAVLMRMKNESNQMIETSAQLLRDGQVDEACEMASDAAKSALAGHLYAEAEGFGGAFHEEVFSAYTNAVDVHLIAKRAAVAWVFSVNLQEFSKENYGENSVETAAAMLLSARVSLAMESSPDSIVEKCERGIDILESQLGSEHLIVAPCRLVYAEVLLRQKKPDQAAVELKKGLSVMERNVGKESGDLVPFLELLAQAYRQSERDPQASQIDERIRRIKKKARSDLDQGDSEDSRDQSIARPSGSDEDGP